MMMMQYSFRVGFRNERSIIRKKNFFKNLGKSIIIFKNQMLNRRSTLASSRDRKVDPSSSPENQENMGSLPNLAELETGGVRNKIH